MLLSPYAVYNSAEELFQSVQTFAIFQGYALIKKRTCKDKHNELKNMKLYYNQGGVYNNSLNLIRETCNRQESTRLIDYSFELYAIQHNSQYYLEVHNSAYNHDGSTNMSEHSIAHYLTKQQLENVKVITNASLHSKKNILTLCQNDEFILVINSDIYNTCKQIQQQNLTGYTPIQALVNEFKKGNFLYDYEYNNTRSVNYLFFAYNESIALI
ncbi:614_t:CDS:1 [Cetraspora pellucida]|uniref:614_t:CDS:1 n=1 Tax=Cetraspora pellucida TaxID=1433469 RepID=A0A9N9B5R5_9GLOM|nr:614_t:CDS:1 [Cetraspora pellucida]